jgi:hypothetical protein
LALTRIKGQELLAELDTFLARVAASEGSATGKKYGLGLYFFEDKTMDAGTERDRVKDESKAPSASVPQEIDVLSAIGRRRE